MTGIITPTYRGGFYSPARGGIPKYPELWRGCVGAWNPGLGQSGLRLFDHSGIGSHGTLMNMDAGTGWVVSDGVGALDFDGVNQYTLHPNINIGQSPTISCWMFHRNKSASQRVVAQGSADNNFSIQLLSSGQIRGVLCADGSGLALTPSTPIPSNTWTHVALSFSESFAFLYKGGTRAVTSLLASGSATLGTSGYKVQIGLGAGNIYDGQVDDVILYNRVLTPSEIATLASRRGIAYEIAPRQRSYFAFTGETGPTYTLTCDVGEFALTGIDAGLTANRLLTADAGSFELTGQDAGLIASRKLTANVGEFALTGQDASLLANRLLTAGVGSFELTGQDASLLAGRKLTADVGEFTLTGIAANLLANRLLTAGLGEFVLTGIAADLTYSGSVGPTYTLTANVGEFALTGIDAAFVVNRRLAADTGEFILTGIDANLSYSGATSTASSMYYYLIAGA